MLLVILICGCGKSNAIGVYSLADANDWVASNISPDSTSNQVEGLILRYNLETAGCSRYDSASSQAVEDKERHKKLGRSVEFECGTILRDVYRDPISSTAIMINIHFDSGGIYLDHHVRKAHTGL